MMRLDRREFLGWMTKGLIGLGLWKAAAPLLASELPTAPALPVRPLGRTGHSVTLFALGGEGILRTSGRMKEAVPVIRRALERGVNYFDTAPAYQQSQDYLGEGLEGGRDRIFLAAKTHDRTRDGSLRLLEDSLRRLRTDHLDLWQLHDLREMEELDQIFSENGAIHALEKARTEGRVRFLGITGHTDPAVLTEALRRYPFDTALVSINPADRERLSFIEEFLPAARQKGIGVIAMKVLAHGMLLEDPVRLSPQEAIGYVLSQPAVSTALIGCSTPEEVDQNVRAALEFQPLSPAALQGLEQRVGPWARQFAYFKRA